ncbi:MAG: hypothetical protein RLZZ490_1841 [Cyanobacteriota bacterium]|jgi:tetratricopeptide (TPR) repeat protein
MYRAKCLSQVIIIIINAGFNGFSWVEFTNAQTLVDDTIVSPAPGEEYQEERLIEGMNRGMKQDYRGAIAIFSELIQRYPDYADAYFNRGIARAKIQDFRGAIADQTTAIDLNPQLAEAYEARAKLHWQLGDQQKASQDLQTAITLFELHQNSLAEIEAERLLYQWQNP